MPRQDGYERVARVLLAGTSPPLTAPPSSSPSPARSYCAIIDAGILPVDKEPPWNSSISCHEATFSIHPGCQLDEGIRMVSLCFISVRSSSISFFVYLEGGSVHDASPRFPGLSALFVFFGGILRHFQFYRNFIYNNTLTNRIYVAKMRTIILC